MPQDNPLARLIEQHRRDTGESYATIAQRGEMARSVVHALATKPIAQPPRLKTLEHLAKGLELPREQVVQAAQSAAGYQVYVERTPNTDTQILIANVEQLTPEQRAEVAALVEQFLAERPS
jgi:hypothetical protein